jgi:hypothetical protein
VANQKLTIRQAGLITSVTIGDTASYFENTQRPDLQAEVADCVYELIQEEVQPVEADPAVLKANKKDLRRRNINSK